MKTQNKKIAGFTLIEMLIVLTLLAMAGAFVGTKLISRYKEGQVKSTKIQMRQLAVVLTDFRRVCGRYPTTDEGLDAIVEKPGSLDCPNYDPEGFIAGGKVPKDGFENDYIFESDGYKYVIKSLGDDKKPGGEGVAKDILSDDID